MSKKLKEIFFSNSDCYADTWDEDKSGKMVEGQVYMAMTEQKFVEVANKLPVTKDQCIEILHFAMPTNYTDLAIRKIADQFIKSKDGK